MRTLYFILKNQSFWLYCFSAVAVCSHGPVSSVPRLCAALQQGLGLLCPHTSVGLLLCQERVGGGTKKGSLMDNCEFSPPMCHRITKQLLAE